MTFEDAFTALIGHEGGFQNSQSDRGNWTGGQVGVGECKGTKYGISAASYPGEDIEHMTLGRARTLYLRDFWAPAGCDAVPDPIKFDLFDAAVNSGVRAAVRMLQRAVGETEDGILGARTLQAIQSAPPLRILARFNGARLLYVTDAPGWPQFGRGWVRRIADNLLDA